MDDGQRFTIFRHMLLKCGENDLAYSPAVFRVRFKFAKLSHKANQKMSLIPIPLIVASMGFMDKIWMLNEDSGYWQGVYQWHSEKAVEDYRNSFVLGVMNKRAVPDSISYEVLSDTELSDYITKHLC